MVESAPLNPNPQPSSKLTKMLVVVLLLLLVFIGIFALSITMFNKQKQSNNFTPSPAPDQIARLMKKYPYNSTTKNGIVYLNGGILVFIVGNLQAISETDITVTINGQQQTFEMPFNTPIWKNAKNLADSKQITADQLAIGYPLIIEAYVQSNDTVNIRDVQVPYEGQIDSL